MSLDFPRYLRVSPTADIAAGQPVCRFRTLCVMVLRHIRMRYT